MATPTPISTSKAAETVDEKALRAIRAFMGPDASLLEHLPIKSITVDFVEEKRRDNSNLLGIRILFGHLKESDRGEQIWIMLTKSENGDNERSPEQRFNILDRHGRFIRGISGDDAVRQAVIAPAFKCFKQTGKIEMPHLRAVIKYYFILKQVNPPTPWRIDTHFIKLLTLACKAARENIAKAESNRQKDDEREAAAAVYQRREPPAIPRDMANRLARTSSPDDDSLFIPESPHPAAPRGSLSQAPSPSLIPTGPRSASVATPRRIQSAIRHSRDFQEGMLPKSAPSKTVSQSSEPGSHSFPAHPGGIKANNNKAPAASMATTKVPTPTGTRFPSSAPKPMSTIHARATTKSPTPTPNPISTNQDTKTPLLQKEKPTVPESLPMVITAYRQADAESDLYAKQLLDIRAQQDLLAAEINDLQARLAELDVKAKELKDKYKETGVTKKQLYNGLTDHEREFVKFGAEILRNSKRPRVGGIDGGDGTDEAPLWHDLLGEGEE